MTSGLDDAAKRALPSFDATIRSTLPVAPPIDQLRHEAGSLSARPRAKSTAQQRYGADLRERDRAGLSRLIESLPEPRC